MAVFTVKKELLNEYAVNYFETCSKCKKLSLEREALHEIGTIFRGDIEKRISGNFAVESILKFALFPKLKTERNFHREVQNVTGPESQVSLTRGTDAKLYPTNLDANWSTLTRLCFGVLSPTARQILYSQFANLLTLKPKRIKLARYV